MKKAFARINHFLFLLFITACSKNQSIPDDHGAKSALKNKTFFEKVGEVKSFRTSIYSTKMEKCVYADTNELSCLISDLPLIGISKDKITVDDILERTLVSHEFLGESFKEVLLQLNPEILQMFGASSAVVISDKINPSFYYSRTGAIYLSGRFFWKNTREREIVSEVRDNRERTGFLFQFLFDSDYMKEGNPITIRAQKNAQTYAEMSINVARLLFHELSHANDYFPRTFYRSSAIDLKSTYQKAAYDRFSKVELQSDRLPSQLSSKRLMKIGQILYQGVEAAAEDSALLAEEVVQEFKNDVANDDYGYSTTREDFAMLAEEALMLYYYETPRYLYIIKLPEANFVPPEDYVYQFVWGEKSRVLEPQIKQRASFVLESNLGSAIGQKIIKKLDEYKSVEIPANSSWEEIVKL